MVPYIDEYVEDPQRRVPNDKDIWPNIEEDFSFATGILPDNQSEPGRPTKKTPLKRSWPRLIYSSKNTARQKFY